MKARRQRTPRGTYPRTKQTVRNLRKIRELTSTRTDGASVIHAIGIAATILELQSKGKQLFVGDTLEDAQPFYIYLGTHSPQP